MRQLLASGFRPDAVIAANDDMALGAMDALAELGLGSGFYEFMVAMLLTFFTALFTIQIFRHFLK